MILKLLFLSVQNILKMQTVYNEDYIYKVNILFNLIEVLADQL